MKVLEWVSSMLCVTGSLLIAIHGDNKDCRFLGFILYLLSEFGLIYLFFKKQAWGLFTMNVIFMVISIVGIWRNKQ